MAIRQRLGGRGFLAVVFLMFLCVVLLSGFRPEDGGSANKGYVEGELLVKFKGNVPQATIARLNEGVGAQVLREFGIVRGLYYIKMTPRDFERALDEYGSSPYVEYVEPNYRVRALATPNDTEFDYLWGMHNTGQTGGTVDADIDAPIAWNTTTGSQDVVVAVIDTGVDYTHVDLATNMWRNSGEIPGNGLDDDGNGIVDDVHGLNVVGVAYGGPGCAGKPTVGDPMDDQGHGTHCAGTIGAAGNNARGVVGVNWQVQIMAGKFLDAYGSGGMAGAVMCLEYVLGMKSRGVNVVATSNSWGGGPYSRALFDAIAAHQAAGILFIAAAGNDSSDNDGLPSYPGSYPIPNVISVAATDHNDNLASFSNYGRYSVHVAAPGENILSTMTPTSYDFPTPPDYPYYVLSGTSMACPHVAGLAALLKAQDPTRDWKAIRNLILVGGDTRPSTTGTTITGKRINAGGSLAATTEALFAVLSPADNAFASGVVRLAAINISGDSPAGGVTVTVDGATTIPLLDNGAHPDMAADDGIYEAFWTPTSGGVHSLSFDNGTIAIPITVGVPSGSYSAAAGAFAWTDVSGTGTNLGLADDSYAEVVSPFPVYFYGIPCWSVFVNDNGGISLDPAVPGIPYANEPIPTPNYSTLVVPYWDDLYPSGAVYWEAVGAAPNRQLIIQWQDIAHYSYGGAITFQVVFYENDPDKITFQYLDVVFGEPAVDYGARASVGLQWYPLGTQYSYWAPVLTNNSAIDFTRTGAFAPLAVLTVLPSDDEDMIFHWTPIGETKEGQVYIISSGTDALTVTDIQLTGSTEFSLVSPPAVPFPLAPGEQVSFAVQYTPSDVGDDYGRIDVSSSASTQGLDLWGTGLAVPDIDVTPALLGFGSVDTGQSADNTLTIMNTSTNSALTVDAITVEGDGFSLISPSPMPLTIAAGGSQDVTVRFSPATEDAYDGRLIIYSDDPDESTVLVALSGTGTAPVAVEPNIVISPDALAFSDVEIGQTREMSFGIVNTGGSDLEVTSLGVSGSGFSLVSPPATPFTVAAGGTQVIAVRFAPTAAGAATGAVTVGSNDPDTPTATASLSGNGTAVVVPEPNIIATPAALAFGDVETGQTRDMNFGIVNAGEAALQVTSLAVSGSGFSLVSPPAAPFSVAPGGTQVIAVRFAPAAAGAASGTVTVGSNDPDTPTATVNLSGNGTALVVLQPNIIVAPSSLAFGSVSVGSSRDMNFTIANIGAAPLLVSSVAVSGTDFSLSPPPATPFSVIAGGSQTVTVRFAPSSTGTKSGAVTLGSNDPDTPTISITLSGSGGPGGGCSVTPDGGGPIDPSTLGLLALPLARFLRRRRRSR